MNVKTLFGTGLLMLGAFVAGCATESNSESAQEFVVDKETRVVTALGAPGSEDSNAPLTEEETGVLEIQAAQGGCSNAAIRQSINFCRQAAAPNGCLPRATRGLKWCHARPDGGWDFGCACAP